MRGLGDKINCQTMEATHHL